MEKDDATIRVGKNGGQHATAHDLLCWAIWSGYKSNERYGHPLEVERIIRWINRHPSLVEDW